MNVQALHQPKAIKLRIEDHALLADAGAFGPHCKTELLDGVVYEVSPQYRRHGFVKDELAYCIRRCLETVGLRLHVATEQSVAIAPHNEPQPDIILTSEPRGAGGIPVASVELLVEISDSTIMFDLGSKRDIYASARVPEYWVADVNTRVIHQMWAPENGTYTERREIAFGERIDARTMPGLSISTSTL